MHSWKSFTFFSVILFLAGVFIGVGIRDMIFVPQNAQEGVVGQEVSLIIDRGDGQLRTIPHIQLFPDATVFGILERAAHDHGFSLDATSYTGIGMFIKAIDGVQNGADGRYWQYWVDGEFAMVSADKYALYGGETILWKFALEQE